MIDHRPYVMPHSTPEAYLLELDLEGQKVEAWVSEPIFQAAHVPQTVTAIYQRRRLTGALQVSDVKP